jgi:glycerophosphoryl diester phosphodiesterase
MKTILFVILISFLPAFCFSQAEAEKKSLSKIRLPERGLCAHRGAMKTHPENTLSAFKAAIEAGAHMIEFDVQLTKDNQMVVIHDGAVDRTTNGTGKVSDLTFAEIRTLDAGGWKSPDFKGEQIPTLDETLNIMPYNIWLNIHIKGDGDMGLRIAKILAEKNRLHQAFLACGAKAAEMARKEVPEILICNMERQASNWDYVKGTMDMNADFIQLRGEIVPEFAEFTRTLKRSGVRVNYFGTDSPEEMKRLFDYGVDFPLVNDIVHAVKVVKVLNITPVNPNFRLED